MDNETIDNLRHLAIEKMEEGDLGTAACDFRRIVEVEKEHNDNNDLRHIADMQYLGMCLFGSGKQAEAVVIWKESLRLSKDHLGFGDELTLWAVVRLILAMAWIGEYEDILRGPTETLKQAIKNQNITSEGEKALLPPLLRIYFFFEQYRFASELYSFMKSASVPGREIRWFAPFRLISKFKWIGMDRDYSPTGERRRWKRELAMGRFRFQVIGRRRVAKRIRESQSKVNFRAN